jgi:uncharacterized protein DUF4352
VLPPRRLLATAAAAICVLAIAACGSDNHDKKAESGAAARAPRATASTPRPRLPPVPPPGQLRATQAVVAATAAGAKTTLHVTVTGVIDPLHPNSFQAAGLAKGTRYVGVRLSIKNVGRSTWSGGPAKASTLLTSSDTQANHGTSVGACAGPFAGGAQITPGERQRGCVVFVLRRKQRAKTFQFSPNSPATAPSEWSLGR